MSIFVHSFRTTVRSLWIPLFGALLLCHVCLQLAPHQQRTGADHSSGQWLHLLGLLLVAAALAAALDSWPLFSRSRPGYGWILRIENRPLHGCLAAGLGSLAALAAILTLGGVGFDLLRSTLAVEPAQVRSQLPLTARSGHAYLDRQRPKLAFTVDDPAAVRRIRLRPTAILTGEDVEHAELRVLADGQALHPGWITFTGDIVELDVRPPRRIQELVVERRATAGLVLRLRSDRIQVLSEATRSGVVNCVLALQSYLAAAVLGLAVMIVGHAHLAMPVNLAAGLVTCLLATLLELTPSTVAVSAFARGQWLLGALPDPLLPRILWIGALGIGLLGLTWVLHRCRAGYPRRQYPGQPGALPT